MNKQKQKMKKHNSKPHRPAPGKDHCQFGGRPKRRYANRIEALQTLVKLDSRGRDESAAYYCVHCGWWHLTSHPYRTPEVSVPS